MSFRNIYFILVRPQLGENIGLVARAIKNFNFSKLRIVNPRSGWLDRKAIATSVGAQNILKKAIDNHGTTFMSFTFLNGRSGNYSNELQIFGKQGQPCKTCGDLIKKIKVTGRGTHICSTCQKKYRPRKK